MYLTTENYIIADFDFSHIRKLHFKLINEIIHNKYWRVRTGEAQLAIN